MTDIHLLRELVGRRDALSAERQRREQEFELACQAEAAATTEFEQAFAKAYLAAKGRPVEERKQQARINTITLYGELQTAIALRRSGSGALRALVADFECLSAAFHAANRAAKVEAEMVRSGGYGA